MKHIKFHDTNEVSVNGLEVGTISFSAEQDGTWTARFMDRVGNERADIPAVTGKANPVASIRELRDRIRAAYQGGDQ